MKRIIPILLLFLMACQSDLPKMPSDILPLEKMTPIVADMHLADAIADTKAQGGANAKQLTQAYYEQIYHNHGVSREQFIRSYQFYNNHPGWQNKLYDEVIDEMSSREPKLSK